MIRRELDVEINKEFYYSDSKVVLGYIQNESRRFYVYVANRVQMIRNATDPSQWRYIDTATNPADLATCCMSPNKLMESWWTLGPESLWNPHPQPQTSLQEILLDDSDPEVKREVTACVTKSHPSQQLGCSRFKCFSTQSSVKCVITGLILLIKRLKGRNLECLKKPTNPLPIPSAVELEHASQVVIKVVQKEAFTAELKRRVKGFILSRREESVKGIKPATPRSLPGSERDTSCWRSSRKLHACKSRETPSAPPKRTPCIRINHPPFPRKGPSRSPNHKRSHP